MKKIINKIIDSISNYLAYRKGLMPFLGITLIIINWIFQFFPNLQWLRTSNTFLHLGIIISLIGYMIAWAL